VKRIHLAGALAVPFLMFVLTMPSRADEAPATTTCKDGTTSTATGRGACSGHGGKQKAAAAAAAPAAPAAATAATPAVAPNSGGSLCKDGTTSAATGRGACSGHGGQQKAAKSGSTTSATAPAPAGASASPATPAPAAAKSAAAPAATSAAKSTTASTSAPTVAASNTDPTGATAKCKDGTYSKSQHHTGTCSHHGGVAQWLTAQ
jgi:Protein of unknown function (DUF3761)